MDREEIKSYVDLEGGLLRIRGNASLYVKMLRMFDASPDFAALEKNIAAGDLAEAEKNAHAIKGMTGNLSLTRLYETSTELMNTLRQNAYSAELYTQFCDELSKTREAVSEVIASLST